MFNALFYTICTIIYFSEYLLEKIEAKPIVFGFNKPVEPGLGDFPFQASLVIKGKNGQNYFSFCGGSLIHPLWVLTAAHCIQLDAESPPMKPQQTFVALGSIYRNARGAQIIETVNLTIHPKYLSSGSINNDIGLIRLKKSPKLGKNVKLVQLHTESKEDLLGSTAYLTGFGIVNDFYQEPERLRKATLKINTYKKCYNSPQFNSTQICGTSTVEQGKACKGDSGGPLTVLKSGRLVQVGITSRLALLPFCRIGFNHSVYTKVSAYIAWISNVTGINFMTYNNKNHAS